MEDQHLYQQIIQSVREDILTGKIKPGDRLASIRSMTETWHCTPGTIQRAYKELSSQGLVISRPGQGTHVADKFMLNDNLPLRRARLVHKAQDFLLEALTAGHRPEEVETALRLALDQWRIIQHENQPQEKGALTFSGSHDLAIAWIAAHFSEIVPGYSLAVAITGSLGGLIALAEGEVEIAGCHLWDRETDTYNTPFIRRLLPGKRIGLITLAWRNQGLLTSPENKWEVQSIKDLSKSGLRFVNRQTGSGTRVWLDASLQKLGIYPSTISGYETEYQTHTELARAIAEGAADVGFGVQTAAQAFGLNFVPIVKERYDLVFHEELLHQAPVEEFRSWLQTDAARQAIETLGGYDAKNTGELLWVE